MEKVLNNNNNNQIANNHNDSFINLFDSFVNFYDVEVTWNFVNNCISDMKKDFFLSNYVEKFLSLCKDLILERYILLNKRINFK
jgi:hypothetical protein